MANGGSGGDVFDVRKVRRFVELMKEHELTEIDLQQGDDRISLRRGQAAVVTSVAAPTAPAPAVAPVAAPTPPAADTPAAPAADAADITYITSPMVGTFYESSSPEAAPFVSVGDRVSNDTTVCILEAMKVFNEIPAECSGSIVERLVENGDAIEFGQKLFKVQTS